MNDIMDFNRIKNILMALAKKNGVNALTVPEGWYVNYRGDLQKDFLEDVKNLEYGLDLYDMAMTQGDLLAAKAGLQDAQIFAMNLETFFDAIKDDLNKVMLDKRFNWPEIPEDYTIPEHYNYKGPK